MSVKEQTLAWLSDLPEGSEAWPKLHEEARLFHAIVEAEADVRAGRTYSVDEVTQTLEARWAQRRSKSA